MHLPPLGLRSFLLLFLFFVGLAAAVVVDAESVVLLPFADTTLFQTMPDNNLGAIATLVAGTTFSGFSNRALIKFDVAGMVPSNATIESASLKLTVTRTVTSQPTLFRLHRLRKDWTEGAGFGANTGAAAQTNETTWSARFYPDQLWSGPGAGAETDYATKPSGAQTLEDVGDYEFASSSNLVADVQNWFTNASGNFGWILIGADETVVPSSRRIASREDPNNAPRLTIGYLLPERFHADLFPVADTSLFEYRPDSNLGASELAAGSIGIATNHSRALLRFELNDSLPADAVITAARLKLLVTRSGPGPGSNFQLHRLLKTWGEGAKSGMIGSPAEPGEATWLTRFFPDVPWSQPGAVAPEDYREEFNASAFIDDIGWWEIAKAEEDVRYWWTNAGANHGWILVSDAEDIPGTARRFASRETQQDSPVLRVEYVQPSHIDHIEWSGGQVDLTFTVLARNRYVIEYRDSLSHDTWTPCTNPTQFSTSGPVTIRVPSGDKQRFYHVALLP